MSLVLLKEDTINNINEILSAKVPNYESSSKIDSIIESINNINRTTDEFVKNRFVGNTDDEDVSILDTIAKLRGSAYNVTDILKAKKINLPNCISIGAYCFTNSMVSEIIAPECIEVYNDAFDTGTSVTLNLPKLERIYGGFRSYVYYLNLPSLKSIHINPATDRAQIFMGEYNSTNKTIRGMIATLPLLEEIEIDNKNVVVHYNQAAISYYLFYNSQTTHVYLPSLKSIREIVTVVELSSSNIVPQFDIWGSQYSAIKCGIEYIDMPELTEVNLKLQFDDRVNYGSLCINSFSNSSAPYLKRVNIRNLGGSISYYNKASGPNNVHFAQTPVIELLDLGCQSIQADGFGTTTAVSTLKTIILRNSSVCTINSTSTMIIRSLISYEDCYVYVPAAIIEDYKATTNWVTVADKFRAIEDYPDIVNYSMEATE